MFCCGGALLLIVALGYMSDKRLMEKQFQRADVVNIQSIVIIIKKTCLEGTVPTIT